MLRARKARREDALDDRRRPSRSATPQGGKAALDPEQETMLADSVGLALLVVLDTLAPAERISFVLHDMFAVPFEEIAASSAARPPRRASSPAAPAAACREPTRPPAPSSSTQRKIIESFSPLCALGMSKHSSPCSIPMSSSAPTAPRSPQRRCAKSGAHVTGRRKPSPPHVVHALHGRHHRRLRGPHHCAEGTSLPRSALHLRQGQDRRLRSHRRPRAPAPAQPRRLEP